MSEEVGNDVPKEQNDVTPPKEIEGEFVVVDVDESHGSSAEQDLSLELEDYTKIESLNEDDRETKDTLDENSQGGDNVPHEEDNDLQGEVVDETKADLIKLDEDKIMENLKDGDDENMQDALEVVVQDEDMNPIKDDNDFQGIDEGSMDEEEFDYDDDSVDGSIDGSANNKSYTEMESEDMDCPEDMLTPNIQELVNQALEKKLGGFQTQMQQMLAAFQSSPGSPEKKQLSGKRNSQYEKGKGKVNEMHGAKEETITHKQDTEPRELFKPHEEVPDEAEALFKTQQKKEENLIKWGKFLGEVASVLGMECDEGEKSVLDETVLSGKKKQLEFLPADGYLKEQWQKANDGTLSNRHARYDGHYYWSSEDMDTYGKTCEINDEVRNHIRYVHGYRGKKLGLPGAYAKPLQEANTIERMLRQQQKVYSYASYFLSALGKTVNGQVETEKELTDELFQSLGYCLKEMCQMSVKATVASIKARRMMILESMNVNKGIYQDLNKWPIAKSLFPADIKDTLKQYGMELKGQVGESSRRATNERQQTDGSRQQSQQSMRKPQGSTRENGNQSANKNGVSGQGRPGGRNEPRRAPKANRPNFSPGVERPGQNRSWVAQRSGENQPQQARRSDRRRRTQAQRAPKAAAINKSMGSQRHEGNQRSGKGMNANRSGNQQGGSLQGRRKEGINGGKRRFSGGGVSGSAKRTRQSNLTAPGRNQTSLRRIGSDIPPYSSDMYLTGGLGYSGLSQDVISPIMMADRDRLLNSYNSSATPRLYGSILDSEMSSLYQPSLQMGGDLYRPGDASSLLGYTSFTGLPTHQVTRGFRGTDGY